MQIYQEMPQSHPRNGNGQGQETSINKINNGMYVYHIFSIVLYKVLNHLKDKAIG